MQILWGGNIFKQQAKQRSHMQALCRNNTFQLRNLLQMCFLHIQCKVCQVFTTQGLQGNAPKQGDSACMVSLQALPAQNGMFMLLQQHVGHPHKALCSKRLVSAGQHSACLTTSHKASRGHPKSCNWCITNDTRGLLLRWLYQQNGTVGKYFYLQCLPCLLY